MVGCFESFSESEEASDSTLGKAGAVRGGLRAASARTLSGPLRLCRITQGGGSGEEEKEEGEGEGAGFYLGCSGDSRGPVGPV